VVSICWFVNGVKVSFEDRNSECRFPDLFSGDYPALPGSHFNACAALRLL